MRTAYGLIVFPLLLLQSVAAFVPAFSSAHSLSFGSKSCTDWRPALLRATENDKEESSVPEEGSAPDSAPMPPRPAPLPARKRLDPLMMSVTRNNDPNYDKDAKTINLPLVGELTLDKSLYVFLPVAAFGVIGILSSIYVLANSGDAIVAAFEQGMTPSTPVDPNACRGLCSSQSQDLEGLRVFMQGLGKN
jgi:hypothetical protein